MNKIYYVIKFQEGWAIKEEGKQTPVAVFPQKEDAVKRGTAEAKLKECDLIIEHGNGETEKFSFHNQPVV